MSIPGTIEEAPPEPGPIGPHVLAPADELKPVKVLYVVGWKRCGSTVLGDALGEIENFFHAGELRTLWGNDNMYRRTCGCGAPVADCGFWSGVLDDVNASLGGRLDPRRVHEWQLQEVRTRHFASLMRAGSGHGSHRPALASYAEAYAALYRSIARSSGARVIVDTSKQHADAALLRLVGGIEPYYVHLVRDPRAQAYSWRRRKGSPGEGLYQEMQRIRPHTSTRNWLMVNVAAETIVRSGGIGGSLRVRYEDFTSNPRAVLEAIADLVNEPAPRLPLLDDTTLFLQPHHSTGGNPCRFRVGAVRLRKDDEWVEGQSRSDRMVATAMSLPLLRRYGYRLRPADGKGR